MQNNQTPNGLPVQKAPGQAKNFWPVVIALIVLLIIVGVAYNLMIKEPAEEVANVNSQAGQVKDDGLPDEFFSYVGTIIEIGKDKIIISVSANGNYLSQDSEFRVRVDEETDYIKVGIPKTLSGVEPGESGELFERVKISKDDLEAGDRVVVIADENIKGKPEFRAMKVEVQEIR